MTLFRKYFPRALTVGLFAICISGSVSAGIIDQDFITTDNPNHNSGVGLAWTSLAQTFTVGTTGTLASIEFNVLKLAGTTGNLTFDVRSLSGNAPDPFIANALFTSTVSNDDIDTFGDQPYAWTSIVIDLSAANIGASIGDMFAFVVTSTPGESFGIQTDYSNGYSGGERHFQVGDGSLFSQNSNADLAFKTTMNVSVPEPSSISILALGLIGLNHFRRKGKA